jgi:hypothetical protein
MSLLSTFGNITASPAKFITNTARNLFGSYNPRSIGSFTIPCIIRENVSDSLTLTDHPVEFGAPITDHAYSNPIELDMEFVYSDQFGLGTLSEYYTQFSTMAREKQLITIVTGKAVYKNMVIVLVQQATDERTENILSMFIRAREVIIAYTQEVAISAENQKFASSTAPINNRPRQTPQAA